MTFNLITEPSDIPRIILQEYRNDRKLKKIYLEDKPFYTIGSAISCDLKLTHNSIDSYHSVLAHDKSLGVILIDLNSSTGSFIKGIRIRKSIPAPLEENEIISLGEKQKVYQIEINYDHVRREYEKKINDVDKELKMLEMIQNPTKDLERVKQTLGIGKVKKIYVDNVVRKARNEKDIRELFASIGEIEEVYIPRRRSYEVYVTFKTFDAADAAVKWNGMIFNGKRLAISLDKSRRRSRSRSLS